MNWVDILILVYLLILIFVGVIRGFFYEVFGIIAVFGGLIFASLAGRPIGSMLKNFISGDNLPYFLGYIMAFGIIYITAQILSVVFKNLMKKLKLERLDRLFGGVVGTIKGIVIIIIVVAALISYPVKGLSQSVSASKICSTFMTEENLNILKHEIAPAIKEEFDKKKKQLEESLLTPQQDNKKPEEKKEE